MSSQGYPEQNSKQGLTKIELISLISSIVLGISVIVVHLAELNFFILGIPFWFLWHQVVNLVCIVISVYAIGYFNKVVNK